MLTPLAYAVELVQEAWLLVSDGGAHAQLGSGFAGLFGGVRLFHPAPNRGHGSRSGCGGRCGWACRRGGGRCCGRSRDRARLLLLSKPLRAVAAARVLKQTS